MAARPQAPLETHQAQLPGDGEAAAIGEAWKINANQGDIAQTASQFIGVGATGQINAMALAGVFEGGNGGCPIVGLEALVGDDETHAFSPVRVSLPSLKWMPHSLLSCPGQRPARGSSPGATGEVQGWQPMEG